jgi:pyrroline-5-carboxylate reductase
MAEHGTGIAIFGGGKMGEALLAGLRSGDGARTDVVVSERYPGRAAQLAETYGIETPDLADAVARSATLVLAVKPQDMDALLAEIAPVVRTSHLVVSVAAGVTTTHLEAGLGADVPVVRCIPNTPALVNEGMTAISAGTHATDEHLALAESLLGAVGRVVRVPESQLDVVTALSGSGPAYLYLVAEALIDAGVLLGLPRALATELTVQTVVGSAAMLRDSGEHPVLLREAVSSPGGTTVAGIREFERHGLRASFADALEAAARRSAELGRST